MLKKHQTKRMGIAGAILLSLLIWLGERHSPAVSLPPATTTQQQQQRAGGAIWSSTSRMTSEENALQHFKKHGRDMGFQSADQYIEATHRFIENPPKGTLRAIEKDGDLALYNPDLNLFAVARPDGVPRTFYRPDRTPRIFRHQD